MLIPHYLDITVHVWASNFLPNEPRLADRCQREYYRDKGVPMLLEYAKQEIQRKERVVVENEDWLVVVPYWATWPFQTLLLPRRHVLRLNDLSNEERQSKRLLIKNHSFRVAFRLLLMGVLLHCRLFSI
ncbi:Galactose-1-phosphate uridylyltransferase [Acipenser ruthenus]|uniref:Galactose-1-phosphate uridylyltransferase n=1 Tax=Acipenser ruthenus TaxID=7906 RepID=A0A444V3L4_ACIRT|nr:Galactose-1-phosphate uridylyltransferase [Acipenser ruthenus]